MEFNEKGKAYIGLWIAKEKDGTLKLDWNKNPYARGSMKVILEDGTKADCWVTFEMESDARLRENPKRPERKLVLQLKDAVGNKPKADNADFNGYDDATELL